MESARQANSLVLCTYGLFMARAAVRAHYLRGPVRRKCVLHKSSVPILAAFRDTSVSVACCSDQFNVGCGVQFRQKLNLMCCGIKGRNAKFN